MERGDLDLSDEPADVTMDSDEESGTLPAPTRGRGRGGGRGRGSRGGAKGGGESLTWLSGCAFSLTLLN